MENKVQEISQKLKPKDEETFTEEIKRDREDRSRRSNYHLQGIPRSKNREKVGNNPKNNRKIFPSAKE